MDFLSIGLKIFVFICIALKNFLCYTYFNNSFSYYLVNREKESWDEAIETGFYKLKSGDYKEYGEKKLGDFLTNLGG